MRQGFRWSQWLVLALITGILCVSSQAQNNRIPNKIYISPISTLGFPDVSLDFRVVDSLGRGVPNLTSNDIIVTEFGQRLTSDRLSLQSSSDAPITIVFVIDRGQYTAAAFEEEVYSSMNLLTEAGRFRDGIDNVAIISTYGSTFEPTLPLTSSLSSYQAALNNISLEPSGQRTDTLVAIANAINQVTALGLHESGSVALVVVGRVIETGISAVTTDTVTQLAQSYSIPIYTLHTTLNDSEPERQVLQELAQDTGGTYTQLANSRDNRISVTTAIYDNLALSRERYTVRYRSTNGSSSSRQVQIAVGNISASESYTVVVAAPSVSIIQPANTAIIDRQLVIDEANASLSFGLSSVPVVASISWQDDYPRNLSQVELIVQADGLTLQTIPIVPSTSNTIEFTWDISAIESSGDNARVLQVVVVDELGLRSESASVSVTVPLVIPENLTITTEVVVQTQCERDFGSMECRMELAQKYAPYLGFLAAALVALYYRRQASTLMVSGAKALGTVVTGVGTQVRKTIVGAFTGVQAPERGQVSPSHSPIASIEVLEGPEPRVKNVQMTRQLEIYDRTTIIGRDPEVVNVVFYGLHLDCTVSRQHVKIEYDELHNQFFIIDLASSSGTKLDGQRLQANAKTPLPSNSQIELGQASMSGVLLRFKSYKSAITQPPVQSPVSINSNTNVMSARPKETIVVPPEKARNEETSQTPKFSQNPNEKQGLSQAPKGNSDKSWMKDLGDK